MNKSPSDNQANSLEELYGDKSKHTVNISDSSEISVPRQIDVYEGLEITPKDNYIIDFSNLKDFCKRNGVTPHVVIKNADNHSCGYFTLVKSADEYKYYLTATANSLIKLKNNNIKYSLEIIYQSNSLTEVLSTNYINIYFHETETTDEVLCIDFGTSNTAAGAYLGHDYISNICSSAITNGNVIPGAENIVKFDMTGNGSMYAEIVPTIVSCENCNIDSNIIYRFGYLAYEELKRNNFCPNETFFMEIKRWVTDSEKHVRMVDGSGCTLEIKRKEIIRQYLLYIIHEAEQQFKCHFKNIHITSPVKLKKLYIEVFSEVLTGYNVEKEKAIDEGVAVLYSQIDEDIQNIISSKGTNQSMHKKALIIDCGGGTSDLASCEYDMSYDDDIVDVKIDTSYLNGDCNFGGNNLTYRIMQYMKIVYSYYYQNKNQKRKKDRRLLIEQLIDDNTSNMISRIDNCTSDAEAFEEYKKIYRKLDEEYKKAEEIIPTRYAEYESRSSELYIAVRNNFYFLWNMADQMKKQFYQYDTISRYTISSEENEKDSDLYVNPISTWKLTVRKENNNYQTEDYPDIVFNAKEIAWLMTGDIYYLVHSFLNGLYEEGSLMDYNSIKLSGQSTNIDTFKNGLKEFLPGKKIKINPDPSENPYELKLICLKGTLKYIRALRSSDIDVDLTCATESLPFDVITYNSTDEKIMISQKDGWTQHPGKVRIVSSAKNKEFVFRSSDGMTVDKPYRFDCDNYESKLKKRTIKEISDMTNGKINQDYVDDLKQDKSFLITYLDKENWGFNLIIVKVSANGIIYSTEPEFCSFQSDIYQKTFFEGDC